MPSTQDAGTLFAISIVVLITALTFNRVSLLPTHGYAFATLHFVGAFTCCLSSCLAGIVPAIVLTSFWVVAAAGALLRLRHRGSASPPPPSPPGQVSDGAEGRACPAPVCWLPA
jgi:hypothetical protein